MAYNPNPYGGQRPHQPQPQYGQPQYGQPHYGQPPSYGVHQQQQHQHHNMGRPMHQSPPAQLKRQASNLRTNYPETRWCAVYVDTSSSSNSDQKMDQINDQELLEPIPKTQHHIDMSIEQNIMAEVLSLKDKDENNLKQVEQRRKEIAERRKQEEDKKNEEIATFLELTGQTDKNLARESLIKHKWDLQAAVQQQFQSSPNVMGNNDINMNNNNPPSAFDYGGNNNNSCALRMMLPDNQQFTYQMTADDTIWSVYGKLLQSRPELSSRAFTFQLTNGHKLKEDEFDSTLRKLNLVPNGDVKVVY